jgi:hypothetical protein
MWYKDFLALIPPDIDKSIPFLTTIGGSVLNVKLNED